MKKLLYFTGFSVLVFYGLPYILPLFGDAGKMIAAFSLVFFNPIWCLISSFFASRKNKVGLSYPLVVAVLFAPSVFVFYNHTATFYIVIYTVVAFIGALIGYLTSKVKAIEKMNIQDLE